MAFKHGKAILNSVLICSALLMLFIAWLLMPDSDKGNIQSQQSVPYDFKPSRVPALEKQEHKQLLAEASKTDPENAPYFAALLKMKEEDGKENAMLCYAQAGFLAPKWEDKRGTLTALINKVHDKGWSKDADALKPYLDAWQPALVLIRKGVAVGYARGLGKKTRILVS